MSRKRLTPIKINQEKLKEILDYNPESGIFTWKRSLSRVDRLGREAGAFVNGYRQIKIDGVFFYAHKLAWLYMTGKFTSKKIIHINGVKYDNTWSNLRKINASDLSRPRTKINSNSISQIKGIYFNKKSKKYVVRVMKENKAYYAGTYKTLDQAKNAYQAKFDELTNTRVYNVQ